MHFCKCSIRIDGDMRTVVVRDEFSPVSYPEIEVIRFIHGDDAVHDVRAFVQVEQTAKDEKHRLSLKYGSDKLETIFPGRNPNMTMDMPNTRLPSPTPQWKNPLDPEPAGFDVSPEEKVENKEIKNEAPKRAVKDF